MSDFLEQVAKAIETVPQPWVRNNKLREDGKTFEVGYADDGPIDDDTIHVVAAYADHDEAMRHRDRLERDMRARAALEALRDPTIQMLKAGKKALLSCSEDPSFDDVHAVLRAVIDTAIA